MVGSVKAVRFEGVQARGSDTHPSELPALYGVPELSLLKTKAARTRAEWAVGRLDDPVVAAHNLLWLDWGLLEQRRLLPLAYRLICSYVATMSHSLEMAVNSTVGVHLSSTSDFSSSVPKMKATEELPLRTRGSGIQLLPGVQHSPHFASPPPFPG